MVQGVPGPVVACLGFAAMYSMHRMYPDNPRHPFPFPFPFHRTSLMFPFSALRHGHAK